MKNRVSPPFFFILGFALFLLNGCDSPPDKKIMQWPLVDKCNLHQQTCAAQVGAAEVSLNQSAPHSHCQTLGH